MEFVSKQKIIDQIIDNWKKRLIYNVECVNKKAAKSMCDITGDCLDVGEIIAEFTNLDVKLITEDYIEDTREMLYETFLTNDK